MFLLSLNQIANDAVQSTDSIGPDSASLIASFSAELAALAQFAETLPPPIDLNSELIKQIDAAALADCCSALVSQVAELQKQIDALNSSPHPTAIVEGYGYVVGPFSATDNAIARYDGTTGKLIQNSGVTIDDSANLESVGSVKFSGTTPVATPAGTLWFDTPTGSYNAIMGNGNITQQIGEELFRYGKASAAITDSPLQLVYKTGVVGASGAITFAPAVAGIVDSDQIIGCATENIPLNGFGRVTTYGLVRNITTNGAAYGETWVDNQDIYYNPTTGGLTKTFPTSPGLKMLIGTVINAGSGGSGSFIVKLGVATYLSRLSDVQFTSVATNNLIQYNGTIWTNVTPASVINSAGGAPVTKTANFSVANGDTWLINNKTGSSCTVTLPTPSTNTGRVLHFQNYQAQTLVSASSNVVPLAGGAATTAILEAVAGANATLVSDGINWIMTQYSSNNSLQLE